MRHLLLLLLVLLLLLLMLPVESGLGLRRGLWGEASGWSGSARFLEASGILVWSSTWHARRAGLGGEDSLERRWVRGEDTYLHVPPGALSFRTLGGDATLASPALRAVPRKVTRAPR